MVKIRCYITVILFTLGIILSIGGFLLDKADKIPFVLNIAAPEYSNGLDAFNKLNQDSCITQDDKGFFTLGNLALSQLQPVNYSYFVWDDVPNDNQRLIEFLIQNFGIDWAKTAKIVKYEVSNTIIVYTEKNHLSLQLNDEKTKVNLKIDDGRTYEFIAWMKNGKLNIYDISNVTISKICQNGWSVYSTGKSGGVLNVAINIERTIEGVSYRPDILKNYGLMNPGQCIKEGDNGFSTLANLTLSALGNLSNEKIVKICETGVMPSGVGLKVILNKEQNLDLYGGDLEQPLKNLGENSLLVASGLIFLIGIILSISFFIIERRFKDKNEKN